jgi:hypothetical protein
MGYKIRIAIVLMALMSCKMTRIHIENANVKPAELSPIVYNKGRELDTVKSFTQFLNYVKYSYNFDTTFKVDDNQFSRWYDEASYDDKQAGQNDSNLFKKIAVARFEGDKRKHLWDSYLYQLRQDSVLSTVNVKPFKIGLPSDSLFAKLLDTAHVYMSKKYLSKKYDYVNLVVFKNNNEAQFWNLYRVSSNRFQITQITTCQYYINQNTKELVLRFPTINSEDDFIYIQDWIFKINSKTLSLCCKNTFTEHGPAYYLSSKEEFIRIKMH